MTLTHKPPPDYFKQYQLRTIAGEPVLERRLLRIYDVLEWKITSTQELSIGIYNDQNRLVQSVIYKKEFERGNYKLTVTFEAKDLPAGAYYIRLKNRVRMMKEQRVVVE